MSRSVTIPSPACRVFDLPDRAPGAPTGSAFAQSIWHLGLCPEREEAMVEQYLAGNVPTWMRAVAQVELTAGEHQGRLWALPDYLCVGSDDDFVRTPMNAMSAQRVADAYGASLPTPKLVDVLWREAGVQLSPYPMGPPYDATMLSTVRFVDHNTIIERQRDGRTGLVAGHKKDVVLADALAKPPPSGNYPRQRVAIYGWHQLNGHPIQGLQPYQHERAYADYSHGIRLVSQEVHVDGEPWRFEDVLRHPELSALVSDKGPCVFTRYATLP